MNTVSQPPDIILADSQILITEGLKSLLSVNHVVSHVVTSKNALLDKLSLKIPDILIIDFCLLDFDGYDDLKELRINYPEMGIIILTNSLTRSDVVELHNSGIKNILHKSLEKEELFECIESVLKGRKYYSGPVLDLLLEPNEKKSASSSHVQLTASETDIVRLIAEGLTNKEIAQKKFLSIHTIMTHRKNIMRKLGVSNASEMIMFAIKAGIIDNIEYHI